MQHPSSNNFFNNNYNIPSPILSPSSSSLYHIPSSPIHYEDELLLLQALILQQQQQSQPLIIEEEETNKAQITIADPISNKNIDNNNNNGGPNKKSKKDRHSKITTAHGPRDRRMRLSLDVAREFFDLQDTLGFDKASKTVDWLLTKSSEAIRDLASSLGLTNNFNQPSPSSEYSSAGISGDEKNKKKKKKKKGKPARIRAAFMALTKESRKKARERARERTMMKKKKKLDAIMGNEDVPNRFGGEELGIYRQINGGGGIFSQELLQEPPEAVELLSSQFLLHVNNQLSPFRDFPPETIW